MFRIQDFSQKTGISKRMLRYLEEQGLLVPMRAENDYRTYSTQHIEEVRWIQFWQRLGFSFAQIKTLKTLTSGQIEQQLEDLFQKKKEELSVQYIQMANIRSLISKMKKKVKSVDIRKDFEDLQTWTSSARENFLSQIADPVRVVYGKFPEMENFLNSFVLQMSNKGYPIENLGCDIMKLGEASHQMGAAEVAISERKADYTYFFAAFSGAMLFDEQTERIEEAIIYCFEHSLNEAFYESRLEHAGRLFCIQDIQQFLAPREIVFRSSMRLAGTAHGFSLIIPFQFVHASRTLGNSELSILSRTLQKSIIQLSEEQILRKTKEISNENYLLTALLADAQTRHFMFSNLSSVARSKVSSDMLKLIENIREAWASTKG